MTTKVTRRDNFDRSSKTPTNILRINSNEFQSWLQNVSLFTLITFFAVCYILYDKRNITPNNYASSTSNATSIVRNLSLPNVETNKKQLFSTINIYRVKFFNRQEVDINKLATETRESKNTIPTGQQGDEKNVTKPYVQNAMRSIVLEAIIMASCQIVLSIFFPFIAAATRISRLLRTNVRIATRISRTSVIASRLSRISIKLWQRLVSFYSRTGASKVVTRGKKIIKMILHFDDTFHTNEEEAGAATSNIHSNNNESSNSIHSESTHSNKNTAFN